MGAPLFSTNGHSDRFNPNPGTQQVSFQGTSNSSNGHYGPRNIDNSPSWLNQKNTLTDDGQTPENKSRKKSRLFVTHGTVLNITPASGLRAMPLSLDNGLPAAVLQFGTDEDNDVEFSCHFDSCAAMNTANLLLHQWIITSYPHIVDSYEQYNDNLPFQPIELDCAIPNADSKDYCNRLTAVVTYNTHYRKPDGTNMKLSFGLGESISVNAIIGLPTLREWKMVLDMDTGLATSKLLNKEFILSFQHAASGFPEGVTFKKEEFVRPIRHTPSGLALLCKASSTALANITECAATAPVSIKDDNNITPAIQGEDE